MNARLMLVRLCHRRTKQGSSIFPVLFCPVTIPRREFAGRYAGRQTVNPDEVRLARAQVEEVSRETGHLGARVAALEEGNRGKLKNLAPQLLLWYRRTKSRLESTQTVQLAE